MRWYFSISCFASWPRASGAALRHSSRQRDRNRISSGNRRGRLAALAVVVEPGDLELVAGLDALEPEREHRIARHGLADLAFEHRLAVHPHRHFLDEMRRHDVAARVL